MKQIAVYAGTFDPITLGHVNIIERSAKLFDQVIVGVAESALKSPMFELARRVSMVEQALAHIDGVSVETLIGLTIAFAQKHKAVYLVRGLRSALDYDYESGIAEMNCQMSDHQIETVFLPTHPDLAFISSSTVRELILLGCYDQCRRFVPAAVLKQIQSR